MKENVHERQGKNIQKSMVSPSILKLALRSLVVGGERETDRIGTKKIESEWLGKSIFDLKAASLAETA